MNGFDTYVIVYIYIYIIIHIYLFIYHYLSIFFFCFSVAVNFGVNTFREHSKMPETILGHNKRTHRSHKWTHETKTIKKLRSPQTKPFSHVRALFVQHFNYLIIPHTNLFKNCHFGISLIQTYLYSLHPRFKPAPRLKLLWLLHNGHLTHPAQAAAPFLRPWVASAGAEVSGVSLPCRNWAVLRPGHFEFR